MLEVEVEAEVVDDDVVDGSMGLLAFISSPVLVVDVVVDDATEATAPAGTLSVTVTVLVLAVRDVADSPLSIVATTGATMLLAAAVLTTGAVTTSSLPAAATAAVVAVATVEGFSSAAVAVTETSTASASFTSSSILELK